ncbi:MAG: DUF4418 family protein [Chloroflexi bacterium]|nr:DUF4418 family protein [Chloroflexota bacterium]
MKVVAAILVIAALVIAIVPQFTDCLSQGRSLTLANGNTVPMKCHWTAQAMIALGIILAGIGAAVGFSKRRESQRNLGLLAALTGALVVLVPTVIIGVCANDAMLCKSLMQPILILSGVIVAAVGMGTSIFSVRRPELA